MDALVYSDALPRLYIPVSRSCVGEGDINCFSHNPGCRLFTADSNLTDQIFTDYLRCDGETDWTVSVTFVGTGIELPLVANCTSTTCEWFVDDKGCEWESQIIVGSMFSVPRLPGDRDDANHTLVLTSFIEMPVKYRGILETRYATVHAGLDTPVGSEDHIWIPARSSQLHYDSGSWEDIINPTIAPDSRVRRLEGRNGSVSMEIFADRFHLHTAEGIPARISDTQRANITVFIDGESEGVPSAGEVELDPGGWHNVSVGVARLTDEGDFYFVGLSYHPASNNVTRIRDITPPALIEAVESEDFTKWTPVVQCEALTNDGGGAAAGTPASGGAVALFSAALISYLCR